MRCRTAVPFSIVIVMAAGCAAPDRSAGIDWSRAAWAPCTNVGAVGLRGIAVVDADTVWVGGTAGTLVRTTDGGASWQNVAPAGSGACDFRDLAAFDAHCALAMVAGQPARVWRTVDGGHSWSVVLDDPRPKAFFDSIAFLGDHGVVVGDPIDGAFCAWTTHDAGRTWQPVDHERVIALPDEAAFAASGSCVAMLPTRHGPRPALVTGGAATRFRHDEDGRAWTAIALPMANGAASRGAFAMAFRPDPLAASDGVVVGGDHADRVRDDGTAAFTVDGGRSWQRPAVGPRGYRSAVVWIGDHTVLASGQDGSSVSTDRGRTWRELGATGFHALAVGRDGSVFACGADGRVARLVMPR